MQHLLDSLNNKQLEAVKTDAKRVLILAGAGSGKTKTLTTRIIYLIKNCNINPFNILAVTFTNKAANEMKERILNNIEIKSDLMIKTFHSFGAFILRNESNFCGRDKNFNIYDEEDVKKIIIEVIKKFGFNKNQYGLFKNYIQIFKQNLENPKSVSNFYDYSEIYKEYNNVLLNKNSFDFEDLILQPVKIFKKNKEILEKYRERFKNILIDEYQDTNKSQYSLIKNLVNKDTNLMVVGDEDQSIYKFRGADIKIILRFNKDFKDAHIIKLEENYRSTQSILSLANEVIKNNKERIGKNLFTNIKSDKKPIIFCCYNEIEEAKMVLNFIREYNMNYTDTVILYRTNNQSRVFESLFLQEKIPFEIIGGLAFYAREEIKDAISILKWIINPKDSISFERFVDKPKRGIGEKSLEKLYEIAKEFDNNIFLALRKIYNQNKKGVAIESLKQIYKIFSDMDIFIENKTIYEILSYYLLELDLLNYYKEIDEKENSDKLGNLKELLLSLKNYTSTGKESIIQYLENITLDNSLNNKEEKNNNKIKLMTVHNAKGLEFENVFITGVEKDIFPHKLCSSTVKEIEEERRLMYVALTRAKKNLFISFCRNRNIYGYFYEQKPSQFIYEMPEKYLDYYNFKLFDNFIFNNTFYEKDNDNYKKNINKTEIDYKIGDIVKHKDYGTGKIINIIEKKDKHLAIIDFYDYSTIDLILEFTKLEKY